MWTALGVVNFLCACVTQWLCTVYRDENVITYRGTEMEKLWGVLSFNSLVLFGCSWLDLRVSLLCCPSSLLPLNQCLLERGGRRIKSNYSIIYILKILKLHCTVRFIAIDKRNLYSIVQFSTFFFFLIENCTILNLYYNYPIYYKIK